MNLNFSSRVLPPNTTPPPVLRPFHVHWRWQHRLGNGPVTMHGSFRNETLSHFNAICLPIIVARRTALIKDY